MAAGPGGGGGGGLTPGNGRARDAPVAGVLDGVLESEVLVALRGEGEDGLRVSYIRGFCICRRCKWVGRGSMK